MNLFLFSSVFKLNLYVKETVPNNAVLRSQPTKLNIYPHPNSCDPYDSHNTRVGLQLTGDLNDTQGVNRY